MRISGKHGVICFLILIFLQSGRVHGEDREVVGYFASWKWYKRNKLVNPLTIDYSKYTTINYAFFKPEANGSISDGDAWADKNILLGTVVTQNGVTRHDPSTSLIVNAHKNNVKVIASIGGWSWSSDFPAIAADISKRNRFALSCVELIQKYNFDGIDIDWEFPGGKIHNGSPADKYNFTLLIQAIRNALDSHGQKSGRKFYLTAAFGPAPDHLSQIDWERVEPLLDIIHIMTYNYYGPWDKITNHNAPLHPPLYGSKVYATTATIKSLVNDYKVPASKITLGLAFYGRSVIMNQPVVLHSASTGKPDRLIFSEDNGTPAYYNILLKSALFKRDWDAVAGVPYLTGIKGCATFVSYDDPESISLKVSFARQMELRGVVIWDLSGDYLETTPGSGKIAGTPLVDAVHTAFADDHSAATNKPAIDLLVFPNPFRNDMDLTWNSEFNVSEVTVRNSSGQTVFITEHDLFGKLKIVTSGWTPGWYIVQLVSANGTTGRKVLKL